MILLDAVLGQTRKYCHFWMVRCLGKFIRKPTTSTPRIQSVEPRFLPAPRTKQFTVHERDSIQVGASSCPPIDRVVAIINNLTDHNNLTNVTISTTIDPGLNLPSEDTVPLIPDEVLRMVIHSSERGAVQMSLY